MVSCKDLLNLDIFKNINLLAGENGLCKNITWPYICQSIDFYKWINGGELLFLTGIGMNLDDETFETLIYKCREKSISGLVVLISDEFIKDIPLNIIELCNKLDLPLFEMPWNIKIIDVSKEISNHIMKKSFKSNSEKELLKELIFYNHSNKNKIDDLLRLTILKYSNYYFCSVFKYLYINTLDLDYFITKIKNKIITHSDTLIIDIVNDELIIIVGIRDEDQYNIVIQNLEYLYEEFNLFTLGTILTIGDKYNSILSIKESYHDALKAFELYKYNNWDDKIIIYSNLGFYKILFEANSIDKLNKYSNEMLKPLIEYSEKNSLNLLSTLKSYLENDCNLLKTSNSLFIHRNTLIYRLSKIKDVLGNSLENGIYKNNLLNAIMIRDYSNYINNKNNKIEDF